ncbi:Sec-independent protein translocase protein TatB [Sphingomicrobium sediminis]|uniref:Sec-independent protein translocase protein TatB n=1 Tax=Sphingomicrobium sediminis TaxID=2950949 RepID=A0A9X2EGF3_9SPHN|nr:Sec-independent protein translocase protein TatB [Sphingomicrobium sediminis]MCM8557548.1 Sec-independent protein translocase protein TatB [Sphingomicrobium sediminis]
MFGIGTIELLVVAIATLLFVGPKQLPVVMRTVGRWVGKMRAYVRHFNAGIDNIVREAELEEMEKQWKAQNEAIMAQFPADQYADEMLPKEARKPADDAESDAPDAAKKEGD